MQRLDHRCCPTGLLDTPQIINEPIGQGAPGKLVAAEIAAVPTKTAVDTAVELEGKLNELRNDNQRLRTNLSLAERIIENQHVTMNQAAAELAHARLEFERVQTEMNAWREELSRLDAEFHGDQAQFQAVMADMEKRLESMLTECSGDVDMAANPPPDMKAYPNSEWAGDRGERYAVPDFQPEFSGPANLPTVAPVGQRTPGEEGPTP